MIAGLLRSTCLCHEVMMASHTLRKLYEEVGCKVEARYMAPFASVSARPSPGMSA